MNEQVPKAQDVAPVPPSDKLAARYAYPERLFSRYDLNVEFARREAWLEDSLAAAKGDVVVDDIVAATAISSLELWLEDLAVEVTPSGWSEETLQPSFSYEYRIPFWGDPELWFLSPAEIGSIVAEGEIFRGHLILVILAADKDEAGRQLKESLDEVRAIVEHQRRRIDIFNAGLAQVARQKHRLQTHPREYTGPSPTRH